MARHAGHFAMQFPAVPGFAPAACLPPPPPVAAPTERMFGAPHRTRHPVQVMPAFALAVVAVVAT